MEIDFIGTTVAALASFFFGALWYSPMLFYHPWLRENGFSKEEMEKGNQVKILGTSFLLSILMAFNLAAFLGPEADLMFGLSAGIAAGLGWVSFGMGILYLHEHRSFRLWLINAGYHTISFGIMGTIIGAWN